MYGRDAQDLLSGASVFVFGFSNEGPSQIGLVALLGETEMAPAILLQSKGLD